MSNEKMAAVLHHTPTDRSEVFVFDYGVRIALPQQWEEFII
jgi:hypothetical protein